MVMTATQTAVIIIELDFSMRTAFKDLFKIFNLTDRRIIHLFLINQVSFMNVITVNYVNLDLTNRFAYTCKNKNRFQFSWRFKEHQRELGLF